MRKSWPDGIFNLEGPSVDFRESIVYSVVKDKTKIIINPIQDAENILLKTESRR